MLAEVDGLCKLCPLLEGKLLLSLFGDEMTGVTGLESCVTCERVIQAVGLAI